MSNWWCLDSSLPVPVQWSWLLESTDWFRVDQNGRPHTPKEASPKPQPKTLPRASLAHVCWGCVQLSWTQVLKSREKRRLRSGSVWQHPLPLPASPQSRLRYPRQGSARTFGPGCDRPTRLTAYPHASARWRKHNAFLFGCFQSFYEFLIKIHSGCWLNHQILLWSSCIPQRDMRERRE